VIIKFYSTAKAYGFLSNFHVAIFSVQGVQYPSCEHWYQSMKSDDPDVQLRIRSAPTPGMARRWGQQIEIRPDWDQEVGTPTLQDMFRDQDGVILEKVKDHIMFTGLVQKFTQRRELRKSLLDTGDALLVENSGSRDSYWGNGSDGRGLNKLGRMLMYIRAVEGKDLSI
jgi:ribA/ribD-fused uncharacterized protein